jgi:hypothetical protein
MSEQSSQSHVQRDTSTEEHRKFWQRVDDAASRAPRVIVHEVQRQEHPAEVPTELPDSSAA